MIDRDHWQRLAALIDEAWALDAEQRAPWLQALAAQDAALASQVARALADDSGPTDHDATRAGFARSLSAALQDAPPPDLTGARLGNWRLEAKIGEGGMGQVWRARRADGLFQGEAAIKLLRGDLGSPAGAARFARERALLARLNHPAIARLLDAGVAAPGSGPAAGQAFLVLELASGEPMDAHVRRHAPTLAARVQLLVRVAEAVAYAHARLIVHRDLKPGNVLVTADGAPKLLDFGIAALLDDDPDAAPGELTRLAGPGLTLGYAAPEQITGAPIGAAADVFALGVMLYELLAGVLPFGPRRGARTALEHAVLHGEPRRLASLPDDEAGADPLGPGRPMDAPLARGDLEAIAAKALRKDPTQRYESVRSLIGDLEAWLGHRPVSARRDNWRHNARLWLRRHALLAGGTAVVVLALGVGVSVSLVQRQRAVQAARVSDEVTQYLVDMLASASPERHGGDWPTVLQLLETSRGSLDTRFADSPDTRLRLLEVLVQTYRQLNRLDPAVELGQRLVALSRERQGPEHPRTLAASFELAQSYHLKGQFDLALALLEPLLPVARRLPAEHLYDLTLPLLSLADATCSRSGRFDDAERLLEEQRRLIDALPPQDEWHITYLNHLQVLRNGQGRVREALAAIRQTRPFWSSTRPEDQREVLTMQRNVIAMEIRAAEYDHVEERAAELIARMDRLLGPGSGLAQSLTHEVARYRLEVGRYGDALAQREANIAQARAGGAELPSTVLPLRAQRLMARSAARAAPAAMLLQEARALFDASLPVAAELGAQRAEVWLAVARTALAQDDAALAAQALDRMQADPGLNLEPGPRHDPLLASRKQQLDGQLARLRGDYATSRRLLGERLTYQSRGDLGHLVPAWSAATDLAWTLVLAGTPDAVAALDDARERRPPTVPPGHPLDAALTLMRIRLAAGRDDTPAVQQAVQALHQAQQRGGPAPALPAGPLRGGLGGALF